MRGLLTIVLLITWFSVMAQADSVSLKEAVQRLDKAIVAKDTAALNLLLDKKLSYGHSNGWVQSKKQIRDDFESGKVTYTKMESSKMSIVEIDKDWATVKMNASAEGNVDGKPFTLNLFIMQVWKKDKKGWQLLARQSAKQNP